MLSEQREAPRKIWLLWEGKYEPSLRSLHETKQSALKEMLRLKQAHAVEAFETSRRYGKRFFGEWWEKTERTHQQVGDYWVSEREVAREPEPEFDDRALYRQWRTRGYALLRASHELWMGNYKQWIKEYGKDAL